MKNLHQIPHPRAGNDRGADREDLDSFEDSERAQSLRRIEQARELDPSAPDFYSMDFQVRSLESLFAAEQAPKAALQHAEAPPVLAQERDAHTPKEEYYDHSPADKLSAWRADQRGQRGLPQRSDFREESIAHYLPPRRRIA